MSYTPPTTVKELTVALALGRELDELEQRYAPDTLYFAGDLALLAAEIRVSVVGSRTASAEGLRRARRLSTEITKRGGVVVSGLAAGVDRAAHEGAIDSGGKTIAVVGTSLSECYPAAHASLQARIHNEHLLVSQFSSELRTQKSNFVKRNRTMALLSHASVIVEASDGSGTLSQAAETQRLGRPLFLLESVTKNSDLTWPARFISAGATVLSSTQQLWDAVAAE